MKFRFATLLLTAIASFCAVDIATSQLTNSAIFSPQPSAVKVTLSQNGVAALPIVINREATPELRAAAQSLADYLKRISGGEWKIEEAAALTTTTRGIAIGTATQFPALAQLFDATSSTRREDYLLRSHASGLLLVGASDAAVSHAVWDLLYRLGYRQFFPGKNWEVVPQEKNLSIAVNDFEHPDYYARRIWFGYGSLPENKAPYAQWSERNRATSGIALSTGHSYDGIIARNKAEFEKHPEYLTRPGGNKFCVSNPGLRQLVVNDALAQFEKDPALQSVSLDPSDGGGWESDSCGDATQYKSVTDRVITLANEVADAVNKKYPGKYVGLYAYNEHSPPPTIKVHPNVVVSIATAFVHGGFSIDELMEGWKKQGATLGMREYYSVYLWDNDMPGKARGGNLDYLRTSIPKFHAQGAHFLSAESSDNWGPNGLGYYIAARLLWDTKEAAHIEEIKTDFLEKAFGPAREPMAEFYRLLDGANKPLISSDLVGRLYRQLDAALRKTSDPAIQARLRDLALYTRYVELQFAYSQSAGEERQKAFEELLRYTWRIRGTEMVHTWGVWRGLKRDKGVNVPKESNYRVPEPQNPWKSSEPYSVEQITQWIAQGIANNKLLDFQPISYSGDLVPATPLKLAPVAEGNFKRFRGTNKIFTWVEKGPSAVRVQIRHGLINQVKGNAEISLYAEAETLDQAVAEKEVAPDQQPHEISLATPYSGLHTVEVRDKSSACEFSWPTGVPTVIPSSMESYPRFTGGRWTLYFYVPKGAKNIGGFSQAQGEMQDPTGKLEHTFKGSGYWNVPVPADQDGKLWKLDNVNGAVMLMTVPPYLARSAEEMMVPAEILKTDR